MNKIFVRLRVSVVQITNVQCDLISYLNLMFEFANSSRTPWLKTIRYATGWQNNRTVHYRCF